MANYQSDISAIAAEAQRHRELVRAGVTVHSNAGRLEAMQMQRESVRLQPTAWQAPPLQQFASPWSAARPQETAWSFPVVTAVAVPVALPVRNETARQPVAAPVANAQGAAERAVPDPPLWLMLACAALVGALAGYGYAGAQHWHTAIAIGMGLAGAVAGGLALVMLGLLISAVVKAVELLIAFVQRLLMVAAVLFIGSSIVAGAGFGIYLLLKLVFG